MTLSLPSVSVILLLLSSIVSFVQYVTEAIPIDTTTVYSIWPLSSMPVSSNTVPYIVNQICRVTDYGAKGDNRTEDTLAIQTTIDNCGTIIFPAPGKYLTRSINITGSSKWFEIEQGAMIIAWSDTNTYNLSSAVNALFTTLPTPNGYTNISFYGGGIIDGQGWRWWPYMKTRPRPHLLSITNVDGLYVTNLFLRDSPSWNTQFQGQNLRITNLTIISNENSCSGWYETPNTDGVNIAAANNVYISDIYVHNGDDCIPVNAGPGNVSTYNVFAERIYCECGTNGGVVIVPGNSSIYNVTFSDMIVKNTNQGAGIKISEAYDHPHGLITNIQWKNITILYPRYTGIYTNVFAEDSENCGTQPTPNNGPNWLTSNNITFQDIKGTLNVSTPAGCFLCNQDSPCTDTNFRNVNFVLENGQVADPYICKNIQTGITDQSLPQPCNG